jgi:hypothetical protein
MSKSEVTEPLLSNESLDSTNSTNNPSQVEDDGTIEPQIQHEVKKPQRRIKVLKSKLRDKNDQNGENNDNLTSSSEINELEAKMSLWNALNTPENNDTRATLSKTTILMVLIPLSVFYLCRYVFFASVSMGGKYTESASLTYSGILAVVAVNCISFGFVYYAWCVEKDERMDPVWFEDEMNKLKEKQRLQLAYDLRKPIPKLPTISSTADEIREMFGGYRAKYVEDMEGKKMGKSDDTNKDDTNKDDTNKDDTNKDDKNKENIDGFNALDEHSSLLRQRKGKGSPTRK